MLRQPHHGTAPVIFQPKLNKSPKSSTVIRSQRCFPELNSPRLRKFTSKEIVLEPDISKPLKIPYTIPRDLSETNKIKTTPLFQQTKGTEHIKLLIQKCSICSKFCDFSSSKLDINEKQIKRETLTQILEFLLNTSLAKKITGDALSSLFSMIRTNLFRKMPHLRVQLSQDIPLDNEYPHLEFVYRILIAIIESTTIRLALLQPQVNDFIISNLFANTMSPDAREQRMACNCLCSITNKFFRSRRIIQARIHSFILSIFSEPALESTLSSFLFFYSEVMDLLEHQPNFQRMILPLMNSSRLREFHEIFYEIARNFFSQDSHHIGTFLKYVMSHWPVQSVEKQSLLLDLIRQTVCDYARQIPKDIIASCITRIADLFGDPTEDISHQSLMLMCSDQLLSVIGKSARQAIWRVYESAKQTAASHWITSTRILAADLVQQLENRFTIEDLTSHVSRESTREAMWDMIVQF